MSDPTSPIPLAEQIAAGPTDEEVEAAIKPLWLKTKPSREAQQLRSSLSVAFDDKRFRQWSSDYLPEYIWDLVDIAAQWGIDAGRAARDAAAQLERQAALEEAARHLFVDGDFVAHSGDTLGFKIDCDALADADLATLARQFANSAKFGEVVSVPRGGDRFAAALRKHCTAGPTLIVDDVLTTGRSMEQARRRVPGLSAYSAAIGVVIFARGPYPKWITPLFCSAGIRSLIAPQPNTDTGGGT